MIRLLLCCLLSVVYAKPHLELPKFSYDKQAEITQGAKHFAKTCYSCHSMKLMRTDTLSLDAGINPELAPSWDANSWGGHPPPDLSLITAAKGIDYVYSYLMGYYVDESHPSGYENIVMPGTQMPNPFSLMQGKQVLVSDSSDLRLFQALRLENRGSMRPQEFDDYVTAMVAYLEYASDPSKEQRHTIGYYVLAFLGVMILIMIALDMVYWRDIHHEKKAED